MTLLELLIVIMLISVLVMVAYPNYQEVIRQSHRYTAITDLTMLQLELETSYNGSYHWGELISQGVCLVCQSEPQRFTFSIISSAHVAYTIKAIAQPFAQQNKDPCLSQHGVEYLSVDAQNTIFPAPCWR
ncbi:type IV pilin protein [Vibrio ostreicida]|nr:type IV pilin protein [Vibrio ostreicida]